MVKDQNTCPRRGFFFPFTLGLVIPFYSCKKLLLFLSWPVELVIFRVCVKCFCFSLASCAPGFHLVLFPAGTNSLSEGGLRPFAKKSMSGCKQVTRQDPKRKGNFLGPTAASQSALPMYLIPPNPPVFGIRSSEQEVGMVWCHC